MGWLGGFVFDLVWVLCLVLVGPVFGCCGGLVGFGFSGGFGGFVCIVGFCC